MKNKSRSYVKIYFYKIILEDKEKIKVIGQSPV